MKFGAGADLPVEHRRRRSRAIGRTSLVVQAADLADGARATDLDEGIGRQNPAHAFEQAAQNFLAGGLQVARQRDHVVHGEVGGQIALAADLCSAGAQGSLHPIERERPHQRTSKQNRAEMFLSGSYCSGCGVRRVAAEGGAWLSKPLGQTAFREDAKGVSPGFRRIGRLECGSGGLGGSCRVGDGDVYRGYGADVSGYRECGYQVERTSGGGGLEVFLEVRSGADAEGPGA